ncbi:MAG: aminodeoxychorismate synthase component I, partial [Acidobacteria bacterium]|nr:aminodeoxychorismate synthase component I [Acidobacteriota bacterium]
MADNLEAIFRTPFAGPWRRFASPMRVIRASESSEVRTALEDVDAAVSEGMYAAGYVAYEAAGAFGLPVGPPPRGLPLVCFGIFTPANVETLARFPAGGRSEVTEWLPSIDHDAYLRAIAMIKDRIAAGDTYQINFTFRLKAMFNGDPRGLLQNLYAYQAGPWSAFVDIGSHAICSASPELFYKKTGRALECRPMKGTAARGWWPAQDMDRGLELQRSAKNRAENVMIVDMVRNDLGRVATTGSIRAEPLFEIERYPLQWQMTSRVTADLPGVRLVSLFEAAFPSGSVTGAPKHSAMGIIRELESTPRGVYTGAIGYLSPNNRAHFNVAIRTVVVDRSHGEAEFGVGSGVVWDSVDRDEYDECLIKAWMLRGSHVSVPGYVVGEHPDFRLLETIGWEPEQGFALLERHLARLSASAACFGFACDIDDVRVLLADAATALRRPSKMRVLLGHDGTVVCEARDRGLLPDRPLRAALAAGSVSSRDLFLFHKTTRREVYDRARADCPDAEAVILWNADREVTEATDFNIVVEIDGEKVTPPIDCGLLPGTFRAELLARGEVTERRVTIDQLLAAPRVWLVNSVR